MTTSEKNKKIFRNTLMLYFRMLLTICVSLYTSRIVLLTLGIEDFGIYNVAGGLVVMLSFLNNAMVASTQRFLNFEMGRKDFGRVARVFSMSVNIHIIIAIIVIVVAETLGLWFLNTQLILPAERMYAARIVYHLSVAALVVTIISIPYNAVVIANERMGMYALVSIVDVIMKLIAVMILQFVVFDKMLLYSVSILFITIVVQFIYVFYCKINFIESHYSYSWDTGLFVILINYAGWNLLGQFATVIRNQGTNVLLNIYFGPIINAAWGIASQLNNSISSFVNNFQTALRPQIVKSYASNDINYMLGLVFRGAKYSYFIMYLLCLPVVIEAEAILRFWLKVVPDYTVTFARLVLIIALIDSLSGTLMAAVQASGKIKMYQIIMSALMISILPISMLFYNSGFPPETTYIVSIFASLLMLCARVFVTSRLLGCSINYFVREVINKAVAVTMLSIVPPLVLAYNIQTGLSSLIAISLLSFCTSSLCIYFVGLSVEERIYFKKNYIKFIDNICRKLSRATAVK